MEKSAHLEKFPRGMEAQENNMELDEINIEARIIAKFDFKGDRLKRTRSLEGMSDVGDLKKTVGRIVQDSPREILLNNFTATLFNQGTASGDLLRGIKKENNLPVIYEGGIKTQDDVERLFEAGVDRVAINSVLFENFSLLKELVQKFGAQAILVNVNARKIDGGYQVFSHMGRELQGFKLSDWLEKLSDYPNVELILTDVEAEGTGRGFSEGLLSFASYYFPQHQTIPCGGIGSFEEIHRTLAIGNFAGLISATYFRNML